MHCSVLVSVLAIVAVLPQKNDPIEKKSVFKTYWNVPTERCRHKYNINFEVLGKKFNFIQNINDLFRGDQISLLYGAGRFPAILPNGSLQNGGVPQEGNLSLHLEKFKIDVTHMIPDPNFSGLAIIDFEYWRSLFYQNYGTLFKYQILSKQVEAKKHPNWTKGKIEDEAKKQFDYHARLFMERTVQKGRMLRPNAKWGYYGYPHCFINYSTGNCTPKVIDESAQSKWLFSISDVVVPSIYAHKGNSTIQLNTQRSKIIEAKRIVKMLNDQKQRWVTPYYTLSYYFNASNYISKDQLVLTFTMLKEQQIDALVIWGSMAQVIKKQFCHILYDYVDRILGPTLNEVMNT